MCSAILDDVEKYLGLGLANVVNLFNPSLLVLDRRLGMMDESVLDQILRLRQEIGLDYLLCAPLSHQTFTLLTDRIVPRLP